MSGFACASSWSTYRWSGHGSGLFQLPRPTSCISEGHMGSGPCFKTASLPSPFPKDTGDHAKSPRLPRVKSRSLLRQLSTYKPRPLGK